jgi:hypothetical protein
VTPEQVFDAMLCLLSATSYTTRFAEDLEDTFPHVPFPADPDDFAEAARIGAEIRAVETFSRAPQARFADGVARFEVEPPDLVGAPRWKDGALWLGDGEQAHVSNVSEAVWDFSVSRYPVLKRWIEGREGVPADEAFQEQLADIVARIGELLFLFAEADGTLARTLGDSLTRDALGLTED